VPFTRDGLLLAHQDSPYVMESNPFALQWKDEQCSQWALDTDKSGADTEAQEVVRSTCDVLNEPCFAQQGHALTYTRRFAQTVVTA
jgi:hypothetical protein